MGCFCPCWVLHQDIFWVRVRFNNFIVTYLHRLSTLVLKVQPYLIILIWPHLGVFLVLFRPFGAFFGLDLGLKTFLKPVYVDYQFWLWNFSPIWFFFHSAPFGAFLDLFGPLGAIFGVGVRSESFFGTYLHSLTTFVLEVCGFYNSFIFFWVGGWVAGLVENIAISAPN